MCSSDLAGAKLMGGLAKGLKLGTTVGGALQTAGGAHFMRRSEERRVGKECRYRWSPYH